MEELLKKIVDILEKSRREDRLWSAKDVAYFFNVGDTTARQQIIADPGFPKAVKIGKTEKRYVPEEVKKFAERKRA